MRWALWTSRSKMLSAKVGFFHVTTTLKAIHDEVKDLRAMDAELSDLQLPRNKRLDEGKKKLPRVLEPIKTTRLATMFRYGSVFAVSEFTSQNQAEETVRAVHNWTARKLRMFRPEHIHIAWERLKELQWVP
jgi:hypothetical protein